MTTITFKTTDLDTATDVFNTTGELPRVTSTSGIIEFIFTDKDAPTAAKRFRNDGRLQSFLSAKKTVYRIFRTARDRG